MSTREIEFGNNQGNMDDFVSSREQEDAGTLHGKGIVPNKEQRAIEDVIIRAPKETSKAMFDDTKKKEE